MSGFEKSQSQLDKGWLKRQINQLRGIQSATVEEIRDLLLSDEFMTAFAKKFFSTPVDGGIVAYDSAESVQSVKIDNVFGEVVVGLPETKINTTFNWHGSKQENEVSE